MPYSELEILAVNKFLPDVAVVSSIKFVSYTFYTSNLKYVARTRPACEARVRTGTRGCKQLLRIGSRAGLNVISLSVSGFSFWPRFLGRKRYGLRSSPDVLRPDMTDFKSENFIELKSGNSGYNVNNKVRKLPNLTSVIIFVII